MQPPCSVGARERGHTTTERRGYIVGMISENEGRTKIFQVVDTVAVAFDLDIQALDRFAAEDLVARLPMPLFDNSAMDGYALVAPLANNNHCASSGSNRRGLINNCGFRPGRRCAFLPVPRFPRAQTQW